MTDRTEYYKQYRERPEVKEKQRQHQFNWRQRHPDKALALTRKNRNKFKEKFNSHARQKSKRRTECLDDLYVAALIKKQFGYFLKTEDIPYDLIAAQRLLILTNRKLKQILWLQQSPALKT